jgi:protein O-GlcNAc transferase
VILKGNRGFQGPPLGQVPNVIQQRLRQALALHQQGMLTDAKIIYEDILKQRPNHFDALHFLGLIAYQTNNPNKAEELFRKAIKINPNFADAYNNLGILVDLMGFTTESRTGIFAGRPAPIQINYLGFAGTMGAEYIDYILADRVVIPEERRECYSEKVVYLPDSFMANDSKRKISERLPRRSNCNLPETGFVFCSFNNSYKIVPETFNVWMRLLRQLDNSVLWLSSTNETAIRNLRCEAQNRGVDPSRLVFAQRLPLNEDHLARHELADLFLDTLPYNAHTSASDALWAGLPVLSRLGQTFAGRVAASLLNAIDLPELITATPEAYEQMAIDLATHPEKLAIIKRKLAGNRLAAPLFNTKLYTRHIEAAYIAMHERHQAGLPPDHIVVPS